MRRPGRGPRRRPRGQAGAAAGGQLVHEVEVNHLHAGDVLGRADGRGPGGIAPVIGIESNGDLVTIAAQIPAVEVESASGLAGSPAAASPRAGRLRAGGMDAIATWMGANHGSGRDARSPVAGPTAGDGWPQQVR